MTPRRIDLDLVRGVAILLAMGWHFNERDTGIAIVDVLQLPGRLIGWAGVDIFFVLSGFLVGSLIFREYASTGGFAAKRFLVRRAFKIWPVLYLYIALLVITGRYEWQSVVPQTIFHVQNYFATPLNHLWSLAVEEHFYLAFALLSTAIAAKNSRIAYVPWLLAGLFIVVPCLRFGGLSLRLSARSIQWQTQFRIDALACGVLLAYLRTFEVALFASIVRRKTLLATMCLFFFALLILWREDAYRLSTLGYTVSYLGGATLLLLTFESKFAARSNWLARAIAWIGTYSYALYVFQFVPFRVGQAIWQKASAGPMPPLAELLLRYCGALILAIIVTKLLERPLLILRDSLFPSYVADRPPANRARAVTAN